VVQWHDTVVGDECIKQDEYIFNAATEEIAESEQETTANTANSKTAETTAKKRKAPVQKGPKKKRASGGVPVGFTPSLAVADYSKLAERLRLNVK